MNELEIAHAARDAMFRDDHCSQGLGMEILSVAPGESRLRMTIRQDMINGHGTCHGGMIFTLADSCFAFACNSRNQNTVAMSCLIDFIRPARLGDVLTAVGREISLAGRNGIYDIKVTNQDGIEVAQFRGKSRAIPGTVTGDNQP
jgi:acyl-CoA thioesterase